tara:strand:+ start:894 stop:1364 length:471 start_codon:yes stop_codon:yes gene_type:complete
MREHLKVVLKMYKNLIFLALILSIQLNACKSSVTSSLLNSNEMGIQNILNENYSGFEEEEYFLIRNQEALNTFYGKINRTRKPGLVPPVVDFSQNMLLVWCGDSKTSNYIDLEINEYADSLVVHKLKSKTEKQNNLIVSPFSIFQLRLSSKSLKIQ